MLQCVSFVYFLVFRAISKESFSIYGDECLICTLSTCTDDVLIYLTSKGTIKFEKTKNLHIILSKVINNDFHTTAFMAESYEVVAMRCAIAERVVAETSQQLELNGIIVNSLRTPTLESIALCGSDGCIVIASLERVQIRTTVFFVNLMQMPTLPFVGETIDVDICMLFSDRTYDIYFLDRVRTTDGGQRIMSRYVFTYDFDVNEAAAFIANLVVRIFLV